MRPMLATSGSLPFGVEWLYEVDWQGMRTLAEVTDGELRLTTQDGIDVTGCFPELAAVAELVADTVLDAELVLLVEGVPSPAALADRIRHPVTRAQELSRPGTLMVFDILRLYGVELLDRPLAERRATCERLGLDGHDRVRLSPVYRDGAALLSATRERGLPGVLARHRDSVYRPGVRSEDWITVANR